MIKMFLATAVIVAGSTTLMVPQSISAGTEPTELMSAIELREMFLGAQAGLDPISVGAIPKDNEINRYCVNIFDSAKEARHAVLMKRLAEMQAQVDEKLDAMDTRISELRTWTERREQFLLKARDSLIQIFQTMRPDAAALQLTEMGAVTSAAIIAKLEPKISGAILAEMEPGDAAKITMILTDAVTIDE